MTPDDVVVFYESRLRDLQAAMAQARWHHGLAAIAAGAAGIMILIAGVYAIRQQVPVWWPSLPVPLAAFSARRYHREHGRRWRALRLCRCYERSLNRIRGLWAGHGVTGDAFAETRHPFARDLNIFGEGSLFELLCTTRTGLGQRTLAAYLTETTPLAETLARQEAIRELRDRTDLRENVAVLGSFDDSDSVWPTFEDWLKGPNTLFGRSARVLCLVSSAIVCCVTASGFAGLLTWIEVASWIAPFLVAQTVAGRILRARVRRTIQSVGQLSVEVEVLRHGLQLLESQEFRCRKLRSLVGQTQKAAWTLRGLERWLNLLHQRNKPWFDTLSLAILGGTQLSMAIENWRSRNGAALRAWIEAWGEFEALNALATYAFEHPEDPFPDVSDRAANFEATALGHPLLPRESCVRNSVELNSNCRFWILSGSNMSGKSTLLRAIGLNAVLANAGAPVCAQALRLSQFSVGASIAVVDSPGNGKSKFLEEVEKLRKILELASGDRPTLFLIDEILNGTNSRDRRVAAEAVIFALIERGAIGVVSTHDLALTEIAATPVRNGENLHFGSRPGGGPLDFDYSLKAGVTQEANALAIARMVGVAV